MTNNYRQLIKDANAPKEIKKKDKLLESNLAHRSNQNGPIPKGRFLSVKHKHNCSPHGFSKQESLLFLILFFLYTRGIRLLVHKMLHQV